MIHLNEEDIAQMENRYRGNLFNTISGFKSGNLIGTTDESGNSNLAIFNSVVHIGANPPYLGFILRPTTVDRHTYENIKSTGFYTLNHVHEDFIAKAHQTSAKYDRNISEFDACGFQKQILDDFHAPYVKESTIKLGLRFEEELPITVNSTILVVGKIHHAYLDQKLIAEDGSVDLSGAGTVAISGLYEYFKPIKLKKFAYAKP
ncbi:NADH-FMN oxidoreductase RutF, flavin reductase (DIM6/NTAB) family [Marivirga sericea]|uniref:NADH-FMN oxidoreductase RutF, flavin reductase (DIM6/NTAB) family n=1 Tax=Marivirga sericea TaxID=1028 RepID=A0A1X7I5S6_9BACT|nr:flavin reductase [Marivirga sericea]SMG09820.1 NADH-FMN oxidoreductase RutF, flavin reductase (DIM6/NTAB) family [Marivirga sericea]